MSGWWPTVAGTIAAGVVGVAYRARTLTRSGAVAAWVVGTTPPNINTVVPACSLLLFFATSSALTRAGGRRKAHVASEYAKGGRRDWGQVVANGGLATLLAVVLGAGPSAWRPWAFSALVGALAAATADTWATEIGSLHPAPRLITSAARVPPGTSGGVSWWGLGASLAGGALLGGSTALLTWIPWSGWNPVSRANVVMLTGGGALAGLVGSLFDSWLGATVQTMYYCPRCEKETEQRVHRCGTATHRIRGWTWVSNDVVNFAATAVGSIMAVLTYIAYAL